MSIRPTDLPMTPIHEGDAVRRVQAKPEARERSRQPAHEREDADDAEDRDDRHSAEGEDGAEMDADAASALVDLSDQFRREAADEPAGEPVDLADFDEQQEEPRPGERHLDIEA